MSKQVQCPNCKSYNVKVTDKARKWTLGIVFLIAGAAFYYLGYIADAGLLSVALVIGVAMIPIGLFYMLLALTHKQDTAVCKECKMKFTP